MLYGAAPLSFPYRSSKYYETREDGIKWLKKARDEFKIPIITEFMPSLFNTKWIKKMFRESSSLSQPALETLAIIAYKGPVTRSDIESIRGVGCVGVLKTLLEKKLIKINGRSKDMGKPLIYGCLLYTSPSPRDS
mgnify:CR=1 FL=1